MSLKRKAFLYILLTILCMLAIMSASSRYWTLRAFEDVERRFFEQSMSRVRNRLRSELNVIGGYAAEWGAWDSMYYFMDSKDLSTFPDMIDPMELRALDLDLLAIFDTDLNPATVYSVSETGDEVPFSAAALEGMRERVRAVYAAAQEGSFQDFLIVDGDLYMIGVSPVLFTNRTGAPRGFLMVGAKFKNRAPEMFSSLSTNFEILFSKDPAPRDREQVNIAYSDDDTAVVSQRWERTLSSLPPMEIVSVQPRPIYSTGRMAVLHSYLWIFLLGGAILIVVMILLNNIILKRLEGLRSVSERILSEGTVALRAPATEGGDEIAVLSSTFNTLLDTLENLLSDIPDVLFICDPNGRVLIANAEARKALGLDKNSPLPEALVTSILKPSSGEGRYGKYFWADQADIRPGEAYEVSIIRPDGTSIPAEVRWHEITYGSRRLVLFLARDITERKSFEQRLARKAYYDDLTGLPNRAAFIEDLNRYLKVKNDSGDVMSAAVMNLDRFKLINEQVGNANGDRILLITARRIGSVIDAGARLYRTGGDEFSLLVSLSPVLLKEKAETLMKKIHEALNEPCPVGNDIIYPSAGIGFLANVDDYATSTGVINTAQMALQKAKKSGLGMTHYYFGEEGAQAPSAVNILRLSAEMNSGLASGEFVPYFQPIYSTTEGKIVGFETLARWKHPHRGLLQPADFMPVAEDSGLVGKIDIQIMEGAIRAAGDFMKQSPEARPFFSSNGSAAFFQMPEMETVVESSLKRTGADPSLYVLEITENLLIENLGEVRKKLERLKETGINIALDDFGTGYSSLHYINQLPLDYLKLDRSFVARLFESKKEQRLLKTIINMSLELELDIIVEGVETTKQLEWLNKVGCGKVQGFLISKPVPWEGLKTLMGGGG
ncbi:MAG: EAL domain-containing protein [Synergistaceae bacterium]|nr:EAL domain-containing protein [Synergistaceae bacterium]